MSEHDDGGPADGDVDRASTRRKTADELPDPATDDARRAVIKAARMDGVTVQRGAYRATRTYIESTDAYGSPQAKNVVTLSLRAGYGGDTVGIFPVNRFNDVRPDWTFPTPDWHDTGDLVLPGDRFGLRDVFVDPASLPGDDLADRIMTEVERTLTTDRGPRP
jgi:hypothetical protein